MRSCFSAKGLGTALLMTLGAVLMQWPAHAQTIGPLQESWDGGKTWVPEGTGRPNRPVTPPSMGGGRGGGYPPQPSGSSPQELEQQRRQQAGHEANQKGVELYNKREWDAAVQSFKLALQNRPDDPVIRQNLKNAEEQAHRAQENERIRRDAAVVNTLRSDIERLAESLRTQSPAPDGRSTGGSQSRGLDFMQDPEERRRIEPARGDGKARRSPQSQPAKLAGAQLKSAEKHGGEVQALAAAGALEPAAERAKNIFDTQRGDYVGGLSYPAVDGRNPGKEPVVPGDKRTPAIARLEQQRDGMKQQRIELETKLQQLEAEPKTPKKAVAITHLKQDISTVQNQEYSLNFQITEQLQRPTAPAAHGAEEPAGETAKR